LELNSLLDVKPPWGDPEVAMDFVERCFMALALAGFMGLFGVVIWM
jgi:hypothetical protein